jgi:DNA-binding Xre family transcriptional regulator
MILCGDLVRAIKLESVWAIKHWWGVSRATVTTWRRALGVPRTNPGTRQLFQENAKEIWTPKIRAKANKAAHCPTAYAKRIETRLSHPNDLSPRPWTPEEKKLLGTDYDDILAAQLGRTKKALVNQRHLLGIPGYGVTPGNRYQRRNPLPLLDPKRLQSQRIASNLTLAKLTAQCGITSTKLKKVEQGKLRGIKPATLERLCAALKCSPEQIVIRQADVRY